MLIKPLAWPSLGTGASEGLGPALGLAEGSGEEVRDTAPIMPLAILAAVAKAVCWGVGWYQPQRSWKVS